MRRSFFISMATCRGMMLSRSFSCVQNSLIDDGDSDNDSDSCCHVIINTMYDIKTWTCDNKYTM